MPTVAESLNQSPWRAALDASLDTLSFDQTVVFTRYIRCVLPLDGYVFWVRAELASPSALYGASAYDTFEYGASDVPLPVQPPQNSITVKGSLHYATTLMQEAEENYSRNEVIFSAQQEVRELNRVSPTVLYIGEIITTSTVAGIIAGGPGIMGGPGILGGPQVTQTARVRFAFSQRRSFYQQADIHHYVGTALTPEMQTQIVDDPAMLDTQNIIVSDSMPIWLAMDATDPPFPYPAGQGLPLFPAMLAPENYPPPFGTVDVLPGSTEAIQAAPWIDNTGSHWQLVQERVRITIWGYRNFNVMDWLDYVLNLSVVTDSFGIMNSPVPRDERRNQVEFLTLAMKKTIEFEINYYQERARNIARQLIKSCVPTYVVRDYADYARLYAANAAVMAQ